MRPWVALLVVLGVPALAHAGSNICWKTSYGRGVGTIPSSRPACAPGQVLDAGLCYPACKKGFDGVGPVCWAQCPAASPVNCGAACATSTSECRDGIVNMVASPVAVVANVVLTVATGGSGAAASVGIRAAATGAKVAVKAGAKAALSASARAAARASAKAALKKRAKELGRQLTEEAAQSGADALVYLQENGQLDWKDLDPTGLANVVDAFAKPPCVAP